MSLVSPRATLIAAALGAAVLGSGCAQLRDHKGYVPDSMLVGMIEPGVDNRDSVQATLGRPSFVGQFDPNVWYYLSRNTRQLAFAMPKPTDQMLLAVHFDKAGNVTAVERTGKEKVASIDPVGDKTPTLGRHRGFFGELFGNIGRVGSAGPSAPTADNPEGN